MKNSTTEGHGYSIRVACEIGVNGAVVIQHLAFLQRSNAKKTEHWQQTWVRRSAKTLTETYPYWSIKQIRLTLDTLEKGGYIFSKVENDYVTDRTKSYVLSHAGLTLLGIEIETPEVPKRQMEVPEKEHDQVPKRQMEVPEKEHDQVPKRQMEVPEKEHDQVPKRQMEVPEKEHDQVPFRADANKGFSSFTQNGSIIIGSAADAPDNGPTVVIEIETIGDGKNGTASRGAGPMTNWTKRVALMFDEVGRRESEVAHIDYQPFNWSVCQEENFRQLKNLRDFAIIPDWKTKYKREPNETELDDCFRIIFTLGWHYLRKIQKEKGGAHHYTPTTIYKQYNPIKTFKHNGSNVNNSGPSDSERDIYRQFTFGEGINDFG